MTNSVFKVHRAHNESERPDLNRHYAYLCPPVCHLTYVPMAGLRSPDRTSRLFGLSFSPPVFLKAVYFSPLTSQALILLDTGRANICSPPRVGTTGLEPASPVVWANHCPRCLPFNYVPKCTISPKVRLTSTLPDRCVFRFLTLQVFWLPEGGGFVLLPTDKSRIQ